VLVIYNFKYYTLYNLLPILYSLNFALTLSQGRGDTR